MGSLPSTDALGWDVQCVAWTPCSSGSAGERSFLILNCYTLVWGQSVSFLCLSYQSWCCFFVSLVIELQFTSSLDDSSGWLFYNLAAILMWSWEEESTELTYSTILLGLPMLHSFSVVHTLLAIFLYQVPHYSWNILPSSCWFKTSKLFMLLPIILLTPYPVVQKWDLWGWQIGQKNLIQTIYLQKSARSLPYLDMCCIFIW